MIFGRLHNMFKKRLHCNESENNVPGCIMSIAGRRGYDSAFIHSSSYYFSSAHFSLFLNNVFSGPGFLLAFSLKGSSVARVFLRTQVILSSLLEFGMEVVGFSAGRTLVLG